MVTPGRHAILALKLFDFLRHFFTLFFANAGRFCAEDNQKDMLDNWAVDRFAVQRNYVTTFANSGFSDFHDQTGVNQLFTRWGVQVVQELDLTRVNKRFAVKTQLLDACGFV